VRVVRASSRLHEGAAELAERCLETARALFGARVSKEKIRRGGRKASRLGVDTGEYLIALTSAVGN